MRTIPGWGVRRCGVSWIATVASLFVSTSAHAQGLNEGLAGLREAYFLLWGAAGVAPAICLAIAFVRVKKRGPNGLSALLALPALFYAPTAVSLIFSPSTDLASKLPGVVGFGLLFGLTAFYARGRRLLQWSIHGLLAVLLVTLISIPNDYWEIRFVSFERVEFVNNVAPKELVETMRSRSAPKGWLALVDGRHLIQDPSGRRKDSMGRPTFPQGSAVFLEPAAEGGRGTNYEVTFFNKTYRYGRSATYTRARYVIPLSTRSEDMYQESGTSVAVLLDEAVGLDDDRMLAEVLRSTNGWSHEPDAGDVANAGYWLNVITTLAGMELHSPELMSQVFRRQNNYYRFQFLVNAGVSPDAVGEDGNSMLHVAARDGDVNTVRWLLELGADARRTNDRGQTPLDIARERHRRSQLTTPIKTFEELLESPP